jgi:competence ComEA-like helix-hairpin-helix protein
VIALVASVALAQATPRIPINTATAEALASLDEVDETEAAAIVALREARGRFSNLEELRVLPGMDDRTLASLRRGTQIEVQAATGTGKTYTSADEVLAEFAREPSIQAVQAWANEYAQTSPDTVRRWLRQSKTFALLPALDLDYDFDSGFDTGYEYYVLSGLPAPTSPDDEVFDALDDAGVDQSQGFGVSLSWDLNELVMSSERIRVIGEVQDVVKLRDKTLGEVTRLYFERRRLQVDQLLNPKSDLAAQLKEQLKLLEMTANLDAYTGGRFSDALASSGG